MALTNSVETNSGEDHGMLVHGSHLEQRFFDGTKWLGRYQVQASRFMTQAIVLVIIDAMISND